jgi:PAS domain S-box-containing protein
LARAVHQAMPTAHLVFLVEPWDADAFRQAMARAPMLGAHWTVAAGSPAAVVAQVQEVVRSTRHRLAFRASLDRINEQRRLASGPDDVPRGLVVSNHYLASILEYAEDAILAIERDDTIATWNEGAARLFRMEPSTALGRPVAMLVDPADTDELLALVHAARGGTTARNHEMACRRSDGTAFEGSLTLAPVRDEVGRIHATSLMLRDVTARRRHEAQIEALNVELEQRLREVHEANASSRRRWRSSNGPRRT